MCNVNPECILIAEHSICMIKNMYKFSQVDPRKRESFSGVVPAPGTNFMPLSFKKDTRNGDGSLMLSQGAIFSRSNSR